MGEGHTGDLYDAVLLLSFGGPEGPDDVVPFLENVTRGRGIPHDRLVEVGAHYSMFGGVSPINEQNRALLAALRSGLDDAGIDLPLFWGNRNWHPLLADTVDEMRAAGLSRVLVLVTSAFGSYSGCRQYLDDLDHAAAAVDHQIEFRKLRLYWNHPGFLEAAEDRLVDALASLDDDRRSRARLVFTAHSVPSAWITTNPYLDQLRAAAAHLADRLGAGRPWDLVFQSRSGPPQVPWLEPDIVDHLHELRSNGEDTVVVAPLGFVSDHMEVVYDLDVLAATAAEELGITMVRAGTVGTHAAFVAALVDLVNDAVRPGEPQRLVAVGEAWGDPCPAGCCPPAARPARPSTD